MEKWVFFVEICKNFLSWLGVPIILKIEVLLILLNLRIWYKLMKSECFVISWKFNKMVERNRTASFCKKEISLFLNCSSFYWFMILILMFNVWWNREKKSYNRFVVKEISIYKTRIDVVRKIQGGHWKTENPLIIFPNRIIKNLENT